MLLNPNGAPAQVKSTLSERERERILAPLREVLVNPAKKCGSMFNLGTRAVMRAA